MDSQLVQRTRYLLKARVKYALTCPLQLFPSACQQWLHWINHHPIFSIIARQLLAEPGEHVASIGTTISQLSEVNTKGAVCQHLVGQTAKEHAAICIHIVRAITVIPFPLGDGDSLERLVIRCLAEHLTGLDEREPDRALEILRDVAIQGLYEYLDEQLDARNALLGLLLKYKRRSEWFRRERLRKIATDGLEYENRGGERALAIDLYEYVYDQGVEYTIEPTSASGEADLVARDSDERYIVVDAKYISPGDPPSLVKKKLGHGFHQVARYCEDHNEPVGYLVAFINHKATPRLPLDESDGFRFLSVKGKSVYYISVNISDHPSASKSGVADEIDVSMAELLNEVGADATHADAIGTSTS